MAPTPVIDRYPDTRTLKEAKGTFYADVKRRLRTMEQSKVAFHGTVKIHGCNITVLWAPGGPYIQSRDAVITSKQGDDCYGAAAFLEPLLPKLKQAIQTVVPASGPKSVMIAGEWAGGPNIQGTDIAVAGLEPFYTIFGIRVDSQWLDRHAWQHLRFSSGSSVYNIHQFKTYEVTVNFREERNVGGGLKTAELALEVQNECPVALQIGGIKGLGEGIVFIEEKYQPLWPKNTRPIADPLRFKARGPHFASSRDTAPSEMNLHRGEDDQKVERFVEYAITRARLRQCLHELEDNGSKSPLEVLRDNANINILAVNVIEDLVKEELSEIIRLGLDKGPGKTKLLVAVHRVAKAFFMERKGVVCDGMR